MRCGGEKAGRQTSLHPPSRHQKRGAQSRAKEVLVPCQTDPKTALKNDFCAGK
jgi:hypothetical protein